MAGSDGDEDDLTDLPARIGAMTQGLPVEIARVRRQRANAAATLAAEALATLES